MNADKKELAGQYKEREIIGGVYIISNTKNSKVLLAASAEIQGSKNRFEFSQKTGSCVDMKLQKDWNEHGATAFTFEVLEELKKNSDQTTKEFKADLDVLKEIWSEKLAGADFY